MSDFEESIDSAAKELETLWMQAEEEINPQTRAVLWGECVCSVLSLEDIREGLTFDEIREMSDDDANRLSETMKAVLQMREPPGNLKMSGNSRDKISPPSPNVPSENDNEERKAKREIWPKAVATLILTKCHFRCCVCPEHRRVADIHHMDGDSSNSVEPNGVGLCKICHTDAHTTSTMQRNLRGDHLAQFKQVWESACATLASALTTHGVAVASFYYMNVHRLGELVIKCGGDSVLSRVPHRPPSQNGAYNTLWVNRKNPLDWMQLHENRAYFEVRLKEALTKVNTVDLNLLETGALDLEQQIGSLVSFTCQFIGRDIPDQNELVDADGEIEGPRPTMRREIRDVTNERVIETCMLLDPLYFYSDSAFLQFSEDGWWNGVGTLTKHRKAVGSNDGHLLRDQLIMSPIFIGVPLTRSRVCTVKSGEDDPEALYRRLYDDQRIDIS